MQFRNIDIIGFKSFADPTNIQILPEITGIVGPNGCGKSNILEAIRWVMGATSAKALRGSSMDDVIFSGSTNRPSRNWAEVSLTLDIDLEKDGNIVQFLGDREKSLKVSRRIYKKNDGSISIYKINDQEVKAKDVQLLFADMSLGANATALVRQGQVGDLINSTPANRHKILEEAAGISGLNNRRLEAYRKLKAAVQNLELLENRSGELFKRKSVLEKQKKEAEKFQNISQEIKELNKKIIKVKYANSLSRLEKNNNDFTIEEEKLAIATKNTQNLAFKHDEIRNILPSKYAEINKIKKILLEKENIYNDLNSKKINLNNKINHIFEKKSEAESNLGNYQKEEVSLQEKLVEFNAEYAEFEKNKPSNISEETEKNLHQEVNQIKEEIQAKNATLNEKQNLFFKTMSNESSLIKEIEKFQLELDEVREEINNNQSSIENEDVSTLQNQLDELLDQIKEQKEKLAICENEIDQIEKIIKENENEIDHILEQKTKINSKIEFQNEQEKSYLETLKTEDEFSNLLHDIEISPGYENAVFAVFGNDLNSSINETNRYWSEIGSYAISADFDPDIETLYDKVKAPKELTCFLKSVGVVAKEDVQDYFQDLAPGQVLVTKEGEVFRWDGFIAKTPATKMKNIFNVNIELKKISNDKIIFSQQLASLDEELQVLNIKMIEVKASKDALQNKLEILSADDEKLLEGKYKLQLKIDNLNSVINTSKERIEKLNIKENNILEKITSIREQLENISNIEEIKADIQNIKDEIEELQSKYSEKNNQYLNVFNQIKVQTNSEKFYNDKLKYYEESLGNLSHKITQTNEDLEKMNQDLEIFQASFSEITNIDELKNEVDEIKNELKEKESEYQKISQTEAEISKSHLDAINLLSNKKENFARIQTRLEQLKFTHNEICEEMDKLEISKNDDFSNYLLNDIIDLNNKIEDLNAKKSRLGSVNLTASDELEELLSTSEDIFSQIDDTKKTATKLENTVNKLSKEAKKKLDEIFEKVNANFKRLFVELFNGGEAKLVKKDGLTPFDSELDILVSPPGKKMGNLSLLSGGEQALTALSLLFGVFLINPAALCILDEVDAPLDDANNERFCNLLLYLKKEVSTKFIIITHNPYTMSQMNRLLGVTMAEPGISRLIGVDLEVAQKMVEEA